MPDDKPDLADIAKKLDFLIKGDDLHIFDASEILVLQRMIAAWTAADGFIRVTKYVGIVLAAIVVGWTQWERLVEIIGRGKP